MLVSYESGWDRTAQVRSTVLIIIEAPALTNGVTNIVKETNNAVLKHAVAHTCAVHDILLEATTAIHPPPPPPPSMGYTSLVLKLLLCSVQEAV